MNLGMIAEADADFERAIDIFPKDFQAYLNSGIIKLRLGNTEKALQLFSKAIEVNPRYANCWMKRGNLYVVLRNFRDALYDLEQAMKVAPQGWIYQRDCADLINDCKAELEREREE
jgi:tetratricopeptide (TPR) repeat protein